ncbi:RNA polymerase sigma factor SigI [Kutzneria kofuensis]|uniref:RNA polymerase sigma-70 factor (ECF subfamily) n=1 Tax=Kutzneria kofuensis TaxID=103725 RepID=A0A7W9KLT9_9PSEU|nr:RNA polymerase sigma factor SigI [Kutzneria kofuensis]MBB5894820.1 RNA polymerase sigma-70 factor (ECF subfamily) [Kutzneria kofuensis]
MTGFGEVWRANRPYLVNLAYRMLGDVGAAEDVVQEAFVRWSATPDVDDDRGWLTVVTSRLCLDQLRSAHSRRELPGSVLESHTPLAGSAPVDPADRITLDDEVRTALFVVLQRLPPAERVAFILHDVFGTPFESVARSLGRPIATCRQLARRARSHIAASGAGQPVDLDHHQLVTERFITACSTGDLDALLQVLHPDVWGTGTFAGSDYLRRGSADVAAGLLRYLGRATLVSAPPLLVAYLHRREFAVIRLTVTGDLVTKIVAAPGRDFQRPGAALP